VAAATVEPAATGAASAATPRAPKRFLGRRAITSWLIEELPKASMQPGPAAMASSLKCFKQWGGRARPVPNPLGKLPPELQQHNLRLGLTAGVKRRDMREVIALRSPREVTWNDLVAGKKPRLEFAYRLGCKGTRTAASLTIEARRLGAAPFVKTVEIRPQGPAPGVPWQEISVELPVDEGERFELAFKVSHTGGSEPPALALANPRITGRPRLERAAQDLNVLLVVVDALRADLVGPDRRTDIPHVTPNLEKLTRRGAYFARAFSPANQTRAATLSILTSQPPSLGGFLTSSWVVSRRMKDAYYQPPQGPPLLTLALRKAGYFATTIGHNRFIFADHEMGLDGGFDRQWNDAHRMADTERLTDRALAFLDAQKDSRFFLMFNLVTPHLPYSPPDSYLEQIVRATGGKERPSGFYPKYLAEVAYADVQLGRVFDRLGELGLSDKTLVVVMADHGEVFDMAHACWSERYQQTCHGNHGLTLYGEETHVPLAFVGHPAITSGTVVRTDTSLLNVAPTILDLLGLPEDLRHVGRSMRTQMAGGTGASETIYSEARRSVSLQQGRWKLHVHHRRDDAWPKARRGLQTKRGDRPDKARFQLYDLETDPKEHNNLALGGHPQLQPMLDALASHRAAMAARINRSPSGTKRPLTVAARRAFDSSDPATNVLLLRSDGEERAFQATLKADNGGRLTCGKPSGEATCRQVDPHTLAITARASKESAGQTFESHPWDEPIRLDATLDGKAFAPSRLRVGPFGLRLLNPNESLASSVAVLHRSAARYPPKLEKSGDVGVFYWRSVAPSVTADGTTGPAQPAVPLGPEAVEVPAGGEQMSDELRKALKAMGYAH